LNVLKQIVLHSLGVGSKGQSTSPLEEDNKQQQQRKQDQLLKQSFPMQTSSKESAHNPMRPSNPRTAPAACGSKNLTTQVPSNATTVLESNHKQYYRKRDSQEHSASKAPLNRIIQHHTPTPSSLASSGIGSLAEEETMVAQSSKPTTHHSTSVFPVKPNSIDYHHEIILSPAHDNRRHIHRHRRTNSDRNLLTQGDEDIAKIQQSRSEHCLLKNEVQQLALSVEEEEIK